MRAGEIILLAFTPRCQGEPRGNVRALSTPPPSLPPPSTFETAGPRGQQTTYVGRFTRGHRAGAWRGSEVPRALLFVAGQSQDFGRREVSALPPRLAHSPSLPPSVIHSHGNGK
ncbi:unnamed protein product [Lampetra fluviatilis]